MPANRPSPVITPQHVLNLLDTLHAKSEDQERQITSAQYTNDEAFDQLMKDKFIALDRDKCEFVYQLILSNGARNVVEAGTSFGVSTIYLALGVAQNIKLLGGQGKVIATENEPTKAAQARRYWAEAGDEVERVIELREGDLLETLKQDVATVDLLLLDIWAPITLPTLKTLEPYFRPGTVVLVDNITASASRYADLIAYMSREGGGYTSLTIPYSKGLGMSVYMGKQ
ncbi:hypothetical protein IAU60_000387 [Kwoniella sp. DSM 27419]